MLNSQITDSSGIPRAFEPVRRLCALVLCAAMLLGMLPMIEVPASAAGSEGWYMLRVITGVNPGDNVRAFAIRYKDDQGIGRTQYIYPQEGDANDIYSVAGNTDAINDRLFRLKSMTGYTVAGFENGYQASTNSDGESLKANSTSYFMFEAQHKFRELLGIDVCMFYDKTKEPTEGQEWACQEIAFFHVTQFHGMDLEGYLSAAPYLSFEGELLAQTGVEKDGKIVASPQDYSLVKDDVILKSTVGKPRDSQLPMLFFNPGRPYGQQSDSYLFELEFADAAGAGIEALAADYNAGRRLNDVVEELALKVTYEDIQGVTHDMTIPIITSALLWAVQEGLLDYSMPIIGIAQQGEHLFFKGTMPEVREFKAFSLVYGRGAAEAAGLTLSSPTKAQTSRLDRQESNKDNCNLAAVRVYPGNTKVLRDKTSEASLMLSAESGAKPMFQYVSPNIDGDEVSTGVRELHLSAGPSAGTQDDNGLRYYIVGVTTDNFSLASTTDDVMVSLQYKSFKGNDLSTQPFSLKDGAELYYGYWPGAGGDAAYRYSMSAGKTLEFVVSASNVDHFTGATFTIKTDGKLQNVDDWQMQSFYIRDYVDQGVRKAKWSTENSFTDRKFWRDQVKSDIFATYPNALDKQEAEAKGVSPSIYLNAATPSVQVKFERDATTSVTEHEERDWEKLRYSMSVSEARQDLRLKDAMCTYTVNVEVAHNSTESAGNGDTGSDDLFYFMLDFENGSSAYVLANQQLEADGFRSGAVESFLVRTNRDYGPLVSVHIISEHVTDDGTCDKLNINKLVVTKKSGDGMALTWEINNIGWIGSDYYDKGAESTVRGRPGRSESELAQVFRVTREGYTANILFALETGSYGNDVPLRGIMTGTVEYYDDNGAWQKYGFDVAEAISEYAGLKAEEEMVDKDKHGKIDPAFMLRGGMVDRFILAIPNLRQISRVTFRVRGTQSTVWHLNSLSIYSVESSGLLQINKNGEYQRNSKVTFLAKSKSGVEAIIPAGDGVQNTYGAEQALSVLMSEHEIVVDMEDAAWSSTITRTPTSNDDSLNVYVYTKRQIPESDAAHYTMSTMVDCGYAATDGTYQVSASEMKLSEDRTMFYETGLPARGISGVKDIWLLANAEKDLVPLDRAVVQHVRSGVTIQTYTFSLGSTMAARSQMFKDPTTSASESSKQKQTVRLFFAADNEPQVLTSETEDLAVAITYRSRNDVQAGSGATYNSRYIYLSDILTVNTAQGEQPTIRPGMIAEFTFDEAYVGEVTGIMLATTGAVRAHIQSACVESSYVDGSEMKADWFSFADEVYADDVPQTMLTSASETVMPVKMRFETLEGAINIGASSGVVGPVPIRMKVYYRNILSNSDECFVIEDLNTYLTSGGFQNGETANVEFFLNNADGIRYVTLEPYSVYSSSAAWKLKSMECRTRVNGVEELYPIRTVEQMLIQDNPLRVNLATVFTMVETRVYNDRTEQWDSNSTNSSVADPRIELTLKSGKTMNILPEIVGTLDGYGFTVLAVRGESITGGETVDCWKLSSDGTKVEFEPPLAKQTVYTIRIASEEMPDTYCDVVVTVEAAPEPEQPETPETPTTPPDASGTPTAPTEDTGKDEDDDTPEDGDTTTGGTGGDAPGTGGNAPA